MANGDKDARVGYGIPADVIELPTHRIPNSCMCTWTVVEAAPVPGCISRRTYGSSLCPVGTERAHRRLVDARL
jgi:hypothetical protein